MNNYRRHCAQAGKALASNFRDPNSSAFFWKRSNNPFPRPKTWLLSTGYMKGGGEIDLRKTPGKIPKAT